MASKISSLITCTRLLLLLLPLFSLASLAFSNLQTTSSLDFLSKLQGLKNGDKAKEIPRLRNYLIRYGYLSNTNKTLDITHFDDNISLAVKTYQTFFNLKPTGTLDAQTISKMMEPRCGFPDVIIETNSNKTNLEYVFFPNKPIWPPSRLSLTYSFPPQQVFFRPYVLAPVAAAFEKWRQVVPANFTFTYIKDFNKADIKISFEKRNHGDGHPFDGPGGVLAHASAPTDSKFRFDGEENWVVGAVAGGFDIGTVALHEIGHKLGLAHSPVGAAIMFPKIGSGGTKGLADDDIQGIKALYG